jgi:transglutaminase/protease-like cytokinesis protein 3
LGRCLTRQASNDTEKAWAIYRWIALNIAYDLKGSREGTESALDPDAVLQRRSAVCLGFSDLFVSLAQTAGLEAATVPGYAKGLGCEAGDPLEGRPSNHAWNAVKIAGQWKLLDCTWGAGAVDTDGEYHQRFEPYYFFTPPEEFLLTHFPLDPQWQLVKKSISLAEFEKLPYVKPAFFRCGLTLRSHQGCVIESTGRSVVVELGVPEDAVLLCKLFRRGAPVKEAQNVAGTRRRGSEAYRVVVPKAGEYTLRIFAARGSASAQSRRELDWALDYKIVAR